jgi:hypothetical protein
MELVNLAVEVPCHEPLAPQFPTLSWSRRGTGGAELRWLRVLAWRGHCVGAAIRGGNVAIAGVIGGYAADLLAPRDLV